MACLFCDNPRARIGLRRRATCGSEACVAALAKAWKDRRNRARRERHQALKDLGLVRVRGAMGGAYYE